MGAYSDKQRGAVLYARFQLVKANLFVIWNGWVSVSQAWPVEWFCHRIDQCARTPARWPCLLPPPDPSIPQKQELASPLAALGPV
jgi:hypothetical protein